MSAQHFLENEVPARMMEMEGATMQFVVDRDEATIARQETPVNTFSKEALERLADGAKAWLFTRAFRALESKTAHRHLKMTVTVEVDGVEEPGGPLIMETINGAIRVRAAGEL